MSLQSFPPPPQATSRAISPRDTKFPMPAITFGLEQEFNFAMPHTRFEDFLETNRGPTVTHPHNPRASRPTQQPRPSIASSSHASGSEKTSFVCAHLRYVLALLNHQLDFVDTYQKESVLPNVSMHNPKKHSYAAYTLVLDDSVMPKAEAQMKAIDKVNIHQWRKKKDAVQRRFDMGEETVQDRDWVLAQEGQEDPEEMLARIKQGWDRVGGELVSKVFQLHQQELWMACCRQVDRDLRWDEKIQHGAWVDDEPHLHVHIALADRSTIPLQTIQGVIALYGLFENEIERWHPTSQRNSDYCISLRNGTDLGPYTPQSFTEKVYATTSPAELKELVYARDPRGLDRRADDSAVDLSQCENYVHVNISLPRFQGSRVLKQQTLEFRQHRGTLDAEEIKWWVLFCGDLLSHAYSLWKLNTKVLDEPYDPYSCGDENFSFVGGLTDRSILDIIGFPEDGKAFFERKKQEYHDEAWERKTAFENEKIRRRVEMRAGGLALGVKMERSIIKSSWYRNAVKEKNKADKEDTKENARVAEKKARLEYRAEKERKRILILKEKEREKREEERARLLFEKRESDDRPERATVDGLETEQSSDAGLPHLHQSPTAVQELRDDEYPIHEVERNGLKGHYDRAFDPPQFIPKAPPEEVILQRRPRSRSRSISLPPSKRPKLVGDDSSQNGIMRGLEAAMIDAPEDLVSPRTVMSIYKSGQQQGALMAGRLLS